ncbi:uncharacterized protein LOC129572072 [Sitodiplosis mosellana]|uniref:uncharacterized protein LOC129572072 n=1 Tax=Sitodiplosis mosellana TaxID=263140 RepID=UPI002443DDE6|nr:uncharacterized protein LOC129572072 [Sitodiplosis mosellana]
MIDLGGEASAISESAIQTLGLNKTRCLINVDHLDHVQSKSNGVTSFQIHSTNSSFTTEVHALVLKSLIHRLPSKEIFFSNWWHIKNLPLADPNFNQTGPIDIILGAEIYGEIVLSEVMKGPQGTPTAQKTELGWILFGKAYNNDYQSVSMNTVQVGELLQKFFEIEEISEERIHSHEDQYVIDFFNKNYRRDEEGRFIVKFPFRTPLHPEAVLGKSRENALKQFLQLERKFAYNPKFKEEYAKNINDYLVQGHMHELFDTESDRLYYTEDDRAAYDCFYLPHHAVIKETSTSTRLRPVYNAAKITSNGNSLNSVLFTGPMLLNDLVSILLNWGFHRVAFIGDIQQMYRQIRVAECDITYQRILWRDNPSEKLREYGISRLGFGTNYAPCGANQCVKKLAELNSNEFPQVAEVMKRDIYMDDAITGSHNVSSGLQIQRDLIHIFDSAGFCIKKWASNSEEILAAVPESDREISIPFFINPDKKIKTLGIFWNTSSDTLNFNISYEDKEIVTKQFVLSTIARIYDPLGLVSPITVKTKIFMKSLWSLNLDWHDPLPTKTLREWKEFIGKLPLLSSIKIPRWIGASPICSSFQLHGFSDASTEAYGAGIYLRCIDENGEIHSKIIVSKSRVSPIKIQTIPRLELSAALILAKLVKYTQKSIRHQSFNASNVFLWCDSQVVLHWLKGDARKWKIFVANRITKILQTTESHQWRYVSTKENPADLLSRGLFPSELENNELWFSGPAWLRSPENTWPSNTKTEKEAVGEIELADELKPIKINVVNVVSTPTQYLLDYCAELVQLLRYTAWFRRFFQYLKAKQEVKRGSLSVTELNNANLRWISFVQKENFGNIALLVQSQSKVKHPLSKMNPFLDENELLRVGGRLSFSEASYDQKHPFILPKESHFSKLVIQHHHQLALHAGVQLTLAEIRQKYWILGGRNPVRSVITNCVTCFRNKPKTASQLMSNLPAVRVTPCQRPFLHTGVDLCGPVLLRTSKKPGSRIYKGYVVLLCA